jgi:uncharacterized RDD family membrane protein YckC
VAYSMRGSSGYRPAWGDTAAYPELFEGVVWRRVFAYCVDVFLIAIICIAIWVVFAILTVVSLGLLGPLLWWALPFVPFAYHTLLIGGPGSATVGMRLFDIEVRSWTGERPGYFQAGLQTVLFYLSLAATGAIIFVVALFNAQRRTLHDYVAGTLVVRSRPEPHVFARNR